MGSGSAYESSCLEGQRNLSYLLFRFRLPKATDEAAQIGATPIDWLRNELPDLNGELLEASGILPEPEGAVLLKVGSKQRTSAARRVRAVLREKGLMFDEGVVGLNMSDGTPGDNRAKAVARYEAGKAFSHLGMFDEASAELREAISVDPAFSEAYHYLVALLRQRGLKDEAEAVLSAGECHLVDDASFQFLFGKFLAENGDKDAAIERLKASVSLNPRAPGPYLQLGKIFQERGDFEASELSFLQALSHGERCPEASLGLGSIALSRGEFDGAEDHLLDALDLNPNLDEARLLLGWTYFKDSRLDQAEVEFLHVAYGTRPEFHVSALFSLAQLYLESGQAEMVLDVLERADDTLFDVPEANRVLGDALYLCGRNVEALNAWARAFEQGLEETPELSLRKAVALSRVGDIEGAEKVLTSLELRDGATTALLELKASLRMANEQWEEAFEILTHAQARDPNAAMIAFQLGWVAENLGMPKVSESNYNLAVRLDPTLHEAYSGLGWLYYQREQYGESLVLFEEALAIQPHNPELLEQVGWVQLLLRDDYGALATLDLAVRLEPDAPLLRAYRACTLIRLGELEEARREVEVALAHPDDEMVEALGHYLNGLLYLEEGDEVQASVELERSLDSQELPPEVVQLTLHGPLKEKGGRAWSEARRKRQSLDEKEASSGGSNL